MIQNLVPQTCSLGMTLVTGAGINLMKCSFLQVIGSFDPETKSSGNRQCCRTPSHICLNLDKLLILHLLSILSLLICSVINSATAKLASRPTAKRGVGILCPWEMSQRTMNAKCYSKLYKNTNNSKAAIKCYSPRGLLGASDPLRGIPTFSKQPRISLLTLVPDPVRKFMCLASLRPHCLPWLVSCGCHFDQPLAYYTYFQLWYNSYSINFLVSFIIENSWGMALC